MTVRYFRPYGNRGGGTAQRGGYTFVLETEGDNFKIGIAVCSEKDMFCRKTGKELALKHLREDPSIVPLNEIKEIFLSDIFYYFKGLKTSVARKTIENLTVNDINHETVFALLFESLQQ